MKNLVLKILDKILFGFLGYLFSTLAMLVLFGAKLFCSMTKVSFFRRYFFSCLLVVLVLVLSFCKTDDDPTYGMIGLDKLLCMSFYFLMTSVFWIEYLLHHKMREIDYNWAWFPSIVCPLVLSGLIELIQHFFISSRDGEWLDFAFNAIGIGLSAIVWSVIFARKRMITVITLPRNYNK